MNNSTKHEETVRIINGTREAVIGQTTESTMLSDLGQDFAKTTTFLQTKDGRTITDPVTQRVILQCPTCQEGPFSTFAVAYCTACQTVSCRSCSKNLDGNDLCKACYQRTKRKQLWEWFTKF
jgi:hypothetical protein